MIGKCCFFYPYVVHQVLQFAMVVIGATDTSLGDGYLAQADIVRLAAFPAVAGQTGIGMLGQDKL